MSDGSCWLWDASTAQILRKFGDRAVTDRRTPILAAVTALQFCPYSLGSLSGKSPSSHGQSKEEFLAVGSEDGAIRLWQIPVESNLPGPSSLSSSASSSENNSRWNMFGSLENPVATFDVGTDICHLQWDRTGQGMFYTTSESEEVNWLRLWSSFSSKRSSFLTRIEVSKTFGNQMVCALYI
jgi:WD40 repeat protein